MRSCKVGTKLWLLVALAAVVIFAFVALDNIQIAVWDGHFPLEVSISCADDREIVEVAAEVLPLWEYAGDLRIDPRRLELNPDRVAWTEGHPFTVQVPCSGRSSAYGRELQYSQYQLLVLQITFADGTVEFIPVKIPDGRVRRQISVSCPLNLPQA
jgi:hypothetical protein